MALDLVAGDRVVDIGCGNGLLTQDIARAIGAGGQVVGIDPSKDMRDAALARCADLANLRIVDGLADALSLANGSMDKAVAVQVLEYLSDIPNALREAIRVLRPGGRLVAVDTGCRTLDWFSEDVDRMRRVQAAWDHHYVEPSVAALWSHMCREVGFEGIEVTPFTFCDVTLRSDGIALMLMHLMSRYAAQNGHMQEAETRAWFDEQIELARRGRFFFSLTYYLMRARKP